MLRMMLSDLLWNRLETVLYGVGIYKTIRLKSVIEGILWKLRTGAPWRDLPQEFGPWKSVFNQFNRWSKRGLWKKIFLAIRGELDDEWNFIDGTIVKVHQHASGAIGGGDQAIGKSRGGNSSKIHMLCDAFGNPIDFELTAGHVHDVTRAERLVELSNAENMIADKGYDSENVRQKAKDKNMRPIIPTRACTKKENPEFDKELYKLRHIIENLFARLKHFRSIATRYEKTSRNFSAFVYIGCLLIWLPL